MGSVGAALVCFFIVSGGTPIGAAGSDLKIQPANSRQRDERLRPHPCTCRNAGTCLRADLNARCAGRVRLMGWFGAGVDVRPASV